MKTLAWAVVAAAAAAAVGTRLAARSTSPFRDQPPRNRWLMVTINCPPARFASPDDLPAPVTTLLDKAEVAIRAAPGDRGTELGLRLREPPRAGLAGLVARLSGGDPRRELRSALRDAKSLIETGEVVRPAEPPTTRQTVLGRPLELAIRRSGKEGRL
jgi:hypothetical protein